MHRCAPASWSLVLALLLTVPVQGAGAATVVYFLHETGECAPGGAVEAFTDQNDTAGDLDGCGEAGASVGFDVDYPGRSPLTNVSLDATSTAKARIYVATFSPAVVSVEFAVAAGNATCSGLSANQTLQNTPVATDFTPFEVGCTFSGAATARAVPSVTLVVHSQASYFIGYEGDHTSRVEIAGADARANASASPSPAPATNAGTPGLGLLTTLVLVMAVVRATLRRRE